MRLWLVDCLRGAILGIACVLPGVSGSVIAMSMGLYQPIMTALAQFRKNPRGHVKFLFPLVVGGGIGVLITARGMSAVFERAAGSVTILFTGLVLGGLPGLWRQATTKGEGSANWTARMWIVNVSLAAVGFALIFLFDLVSGATGSGGAAIPLTGWVALASGAVFALATIAPGISSSFLLIDMGVYQPMMDALGHPFTQTQPLFLFILGAIVCGALTVKVVEWVFRKFPSQSRFMAMGFVLGSIWMVFSWEEFAAKWVVHSLLMLAGIAAAALFQRAFKAEDSTADLE